MARPSQHLDLKLINIAKSYMCKGGVSSLSIRRLCREAGVNLGMFSYLFGSRECFVEKIHREIFEAFMVELHEATKSQDEDPLLALRNAFLTLSKVAMKQRLMILSFIRDAMNDEPAIKKITRTFVPEDAILMLNLIKKCQKRSVLPASIPAIEIFTLLVSVILPPVLFSSAILEIFKLHIKGMKNARVDKPEQIQLRLDILLNGLQKWEGS